MDNRAANLWIARYLATERTTALRYSRLAFMLLFLLGNDALAKDTQAILPIEGPLQCVDKDYNPVMVLIIEVTIPGLSTNKEYQFPLKRRTRLQSDADGYHIDLDTICPVLGESGDSMDLSAHHSATVSLDRIRANSAQIDLSISWKTTKGQGGFKKRLTVPLFRSHEYSYKNGIKIKSYPRT
jgi:hypothetical protein